MAAKKPRTAASPPRRARARERADRTGASDSAPSPRLQRDRAAPTVYGVFFLLLVLACSPALDSKFALPKAMVLAAGVLALGVLLLVRNSRGGCSAPSRPALLLSLALGAWWMISTPFALHLATALDGVYDYYNGLWTHLCWLALFIVSLAIPSDLPTARRIAALLAGAVVPVALVNVAEASGLSSFGLADVSTLGDRVGASALMNFAIPFGAIALVRARHRGVKAGLVLVLGLLLISELLSQGRGAWVGLAAAAVILAAGLIRSRAGWNVAGAMLLGMLVLAGVAAKLSPVVAERFATLTNISRDESLRQRLMYQQAALRAVGDHPLAGIGFENFRNAYPGYRSADDVNFFDNNVIPTMVHNGYLEAALNNGIPALLLYLALVTLALVKLVRELARAQDRDRRDLLLGFLAALGAYLVQDLFGWLDMALTSAFWVTLGLALNLAGQKTPGSMAARPSALIGALAVSMILLSLFLLGDRYERLAADARLYQARLLDVDRQWPPAEPLINKALQSLPGDSPSFSTGRGWRR